MQRVKTAARKKNANAVEFDESPSTRRPQNRRYENEDASFISSGQFEHQINLNIINTNDDFHSRLTKSNVSVRLLEREPFLKQF